MGTKIFVAAWYAAVNTCMTNTIDLLKFKLYNEYLITKHVYSEGDSGFHRDLTKKVVESYIDPLNLPKDAIIADLGAGPGYFLDEMKAREYTNVIGVTLGPDDIKLCQSKGHTVKPYDLSFLPQNDGFGDESHDLIFLRHALEHSPYPIISLMEYNRILKTGGKIYIEVPQPNSDRKHEFNPNHYSILGDQQLTALLYRTGFKIDRLETIEFDLNLGESTAREKYYCIVASKRMGLDIR
jgi:SAM-dependent methyltransferase